MDNANNKKFVSWFIVLILLFVLFLIWNKEKKQNNTEDINDVQESVLEDNNDTSNNSDDSLSENIKDSENESINTENDAKYNALMDQGSKAYNAKDYKTALSLYKQALEIKDLDVVYGKMYLAYVEIKDYTNAKQSLDKALALNPAYNQYWIWKIEYSRDIAKASYAELEKIYNEGINKVEITAKVNFVLFFARVSEQMNQYSKSISLWQEAIKLNPSKKDVYQAEIDRLKAN